MTLALINLSISIYNLRNEDFFFFIFLLLGEFCGSEAVEVV